MGGRTYILLVLAFVVGACNQVSEKQAGVAEEATFASVQKNVLMPKCMSCHAGADSGNGIDLSSYSAILSKKLVVPGKPGESPLFISVTEGNMPKGTVRLRPNEIDLLYRWILNGAMEFQESPSAPPPPPPTPSYEWIQKYVLDSRCIGCHDGKHPKTKLDLRAYESFIKYEGEILNLIEPGDAEFSLLFRVLDSGNMPPAPAEKVPRDAITAIQQWIASGAKKN